MTRTAQSVRNEDPLMTGDRCWLVVEVLDPGNEYSFASIRVCGRDIPNSVFLIRPEALQHGSNFRERGDQS